MIEYRKVMSIWVLYLDESGNAEHHNLPLQEGQTPIFTIAGIALPLENWREYDRAYVSLKYEFFENEIEKSSKHPSQWEFKGNRSIAPRNADSTRISTFVHKVLDLINEYQGKVFASTFLKNPSQPVPASSMYTLGLQMLGERFDIFLREQGTEDRGILILDSRAAHVTKGNGLDYTVANSFLSYIFGNSQGKQLKRLREAPLFADSGLTIGVQIADIIAASIYANSYTHYLAKDGQDKENGYLDYRHTRRYWQEIQDLRYVSKNLYEGFRIYGLNVRDHRKF